MGFMRSVWGFFFKSQDLTSTFNISIKKVCFSHLDIEVAVIARPFTEPNRSLGTELLMRIVVEVKAQPVLNFMGRTMPINSGQRTLDLKNEADAIIIIMLLLSR